MIDPQTQEIIYNATNAFWNDHVVNEAFRDITRGKEIGHRIADFVDDIQKYYQDYIYTENLAAIWGERKKSRAS